ncbi:MAG: ribonuclease P protein component [Oscillospiraceae bacterium]|nr:ribonuclease P protein component [Oscillospiraceae bacterium]
MNKTFTIKDNRVFRRAYSRGRSAVTPFLVVYCRPNGQKHNRLGVTVSTKLGGAVVRNRARRRLREVFRLAQPDLRQGFDIVLVARSRAVDGPYDRLTAAFRRACRDLDLAKKREDAR